MKTLLTNVSTPIDGELVDRTDCTGTLTFEGMADGDEVHVEVLHREPSGVLHVLEPYVFQGPQPAPFAIRLPPWATHVKASLLNASAAPISVTLA